MANAKESESRAADIIKNWLRNRYTIEFLGTWEMMHNPNFKAYRSNCVVFYPYYVSMGQIAW